ncbi:hypothetical protein AX14_001046 [Amanita brunnescens Koide BX004]|nr:hypothetical protein AX14_001046 [Amanita brunnescens Koide BX004]
MPGNSDTMPTAAAHMPLRTSQDAPQFLGTASDLSCYITEVEELCICCQRSTDADLVKWTVYYTAGLMWDTFALTRDALPKPRTWDDFKATIRNVYPQHEAHMQLPLQASLPLLPVPFAPPPSLLPAAPVMPLLPQPPMPAIPARLSPSTSDAQSLLPALPDCL